jgi:hypothetical protein
MAVVVGAPLSRATIVAVRRMMRASSRGESGRGGQVTAHRASKGIAVERQMLCYIRVAVAVVGCPTPGLRGRSAMKCSVRARRSENL